MSRVQIGIVLALLIALGAAGLAFRLTTTEAEEERIGDVQALNEAVIDRVVIRDLAPADAQSGDAEQGIETVLWKVEDEWLVGTESHRFPTILPKMQLLLDATDQIDEAELVSRNSINHLLMGVTLDQAKVVEFWSGGQLLETFLVGDKFRTEVGGATQTPWTTANQSCFLRRDGEDAVYAVYCPRPEVFDTSQRRWSTAEIARIPAQDVESLDFVYPDEEFRLRPFGSVWVVQDGVSEEQVFENPLRDVLRQLQPVVASDFPSEEEVQGLDFDLPTATISVSPVQDATVEPFTLLFIKKGDGEYYVKLKDNPYVYLFGELESGQLLKRKSDMLTSTAFTLPPPAEEDQSGVTPGAPSSSP